MQPMKQSSQAGARAAPNKHVILFLAANPSGTDRLALDREARSIHAELKRSGFRDRFDFVTRWAAEPLDLLREVRELRPTVVHFSGHGGARMAGAAGSAHDRDFVAVAPYGGEPHGLHFHDAAGGAQVVSPEAIAQTLGAVGASVKVVVLNACFTAPIAEALLAHVDCVVGMSGSIHDDAARSFAIGFYGGLGEHESIAAAFEQGRAAINLEGLRDAETPQLKVRDGFDAPQLILAAVAPSLRLDVRCPYPGMRPYTADDAQGFHGRDTEIDELIGRLRAGERELYVIGPSGSGKSSLVAAGVLPRLACGASGLGPFSVRALRPGEQPAARLYEALDLPPRQPFVAAECIAALLAHRGRGSSVLLVVDQLEELFTLASAGERDAFLAALRELRAEHRCAVIVTLRADFFGALMESPLWPERRGRDQLLRIEVSPLRGQALRDAIEAPARDAGVMVEPELIERLLADAASEPGILPLLQETLVQLWDARVDQRLTLADYEALGDGERSGLAVALARRADATLRRFNAAQMDIARRISLRLISFGEGRSDTRRQQPRAKLRAAPDDAADFAHVLQTMVDDRLLTIDEDDRSAEPRVDLAHEVMIVAWPALAGWIRSHRVDEQRRRQFEAAAAQWVEHGRGGRGLLDPIELADAELWQQTESAIQLGQSAEVMALVTASRAAQAKQRRRRLGLIGGAFAVLAAFAVVVAALAVAERDQANEAHHQADNARREANNAKISDRNKQQTLAQLYEELGRQLIVEEHYQEAVPYLLEARKNGEDRAPLRMMFWIAMRHLPLIPAFEHQGPVVSGSFSPDGTRIVTASWDQTVRIWDSATGKLLTSRPEHQAEVTSAAFSPDGTRVVSASYDQTAQVWDAVTGEPITTPLQHQDAVLGAAFGPDGTRVITASQDNTARIWDAATGTPRTGPLLHQDRVVSAAFSPDGTRVVTASWDQTARIWDAATGKPLTNPLEHQDAVLNTAFSPDGTRVVTASRDKTARVWDTATGKAITSSLMHQDAVVSAAFSPDGTRVVTASRDKTARVWDAANGKPLTPPLEHQDAVVSAAFSLDGTRVVTASRDKTARVWDAATGKPLTSPLEHQDAVASAAFNPDGTRVITVSSDKTARVWDAATGKTLATPLEHQDAVVSAAFSPDGTRVATASVDKTARIWDGATGKAVTPPLKHQDAVVSAVFSPSGTRVLTASVDKTARIWDAATGMLVIPPLEHRGWVTSAAFNNDGTRVLTASVDNTARVWDAATGTPVTPSLEHQGWVVSAAFSPDSTRVVTASYDTTARVWNAATGSPVTNFLRHQDRVVSAAFSPDSTRVVTASYDTTARVWDAATGKPITSPLQHQDAVLGATFSPDGTRVVTASADNTARIWDAATGKPLTSPLQHQNSVLSAMFSTDGTRVVTASADKTARVWDAVTGKLLASFLQHEGTVTNATFSADGTRIVTASADKTALVWEARIDQGTLQQWSALAERSPFDFSGIALILQHRQD
jgi:WD40 repeat protein